jgi:hypothetical protein
MQRILRSAVSAAVAVGTVPGAFASSSWSIAGAQDGAFGPGNHGQLLRFPLHR